MTPGEPDGPVDPALTAYGLGLVRRALHQARGMSAGQVAAAESDREARRSPCEHCGAKPWDKCVSRGSDAEVDWIHPSRAAAHR